MVCRLCYAGVITRWEGDKPEDLEKIVDASNANTGGNHRRVSADSGFCSYEMLVGTEERAEEFYVPDRRFEESKKDPDEKKRYDLESVAYI